MKKIYLSHTSATFAMRKIAMLIILLSGFSAGAICQCNTGYAHYTTYNIFNSDTAVTNFQVKLMVNTAALVSAGQMKASGDDIRFTDAVCSNLNYWIESGMNTDSTIIWVKANSLAATGITQIKMFYGNATATAASSGTGTFESFDDFENGSLSNWKSFGKAKWSIVSFGGSMRLKGSSLVLGSGSGAFRYSPNMENYAIDADYYNDNSSAMGGPIFEFTDSNNYYAVHSMTSPTNVIMHSKITNGSPNYAKQWPYVHLNNIWYKWSVYRSPSVTTVYFNRDSIGQLPKTFSPGTGVWGYGSSTAVIYFDNVRVRKASARISVLSTVLPIRLSSFSGNLKEKNILLTWKTAVETNVQAYDVERSADGTHFSKAATVPATGANTLYGWTDTKPQNGSNYYRLKIIDKDGTISFSNVIEITVKNASADILVVPNPVLGHALHLQFVNMAKGSYAASLYNSAGQKTVSAILNTNGENGQQTIKLPASLAAGSYILKITCNQIQINKTVLIQ